jgi:hypothetical protein
LKKFFVLLCVLVLVAGIAVAQIGIGVGADFAIDNLTRANGEGMGPVFTPWIDYGTSFGATSFYTYLDTNLDWTPDFKDLVPAIDADLQLRLRHTLSLGSASSLLLELDNYFNGFKVYPMASKGYGVKGSLNPLVKFTLETGIGDIYARVQAPIGYLDDSGVLLYSRLGWASCFGLGFWAQLDSSLVDPMEMYQGWRANVSYELEDFFDFNGTARAWEDTNKGLQISPEFSCYFGDATFYVGGELYNVGGKKDLSIDVTPGFEYALGAIDFYVKCELADIIGKMTVNPAVGVSFSF